MRDVAWYNARHHRFRRIGALIADPRYGDMRMSRTIQICATWRSYLAWQLAEALSGARAVSR